MERVAIECFGAEVQVWGGELFRLAEKKIASGFEIEMQAFEHGKALDAREVRQHIHTKDAIKAADIAWPSQVHAVESDQAAQSRLHQQLNRAA